jgi:hypothetical protein
LFGDFVELLLVLELWAKTLHQHPTPITQKQKKEWLEVFDFFVRSFASALTNKLVRLRKTASVSGDISH